MERLTTLGKLGTRAFALGVVALAVVMAWTAPVSAHDGRGPGIKSPPPSVFPTPRDPWRSWGLRRELPHRVGPPRGSHHEGFASPRTDRHDDFGTSHGGRVWIPGHWAWDGAAWVWWPGHWGVR